MEWWVQILVLQTGFCFVCKQHVLHLQSAFSSQTLLRRPLVPKPPLRIYSPFGSSATSILSIFAYFSVPQHNYHHQKSVRNCVLISLSDLQPVTEIVYAERQLNHTAGSCITQTYENLILVTVNQNQNYHVIRSISMDIPQSCGAERASGIEYACCSSRRQTMRRQLQLGFKQVGEPLAMGKLFHQTQIGQL